LSSRATEGADKEDGERLPVIVVSGSPGSGKSTIARALAERLGLRYLYTGDIFRSLARSLGVSVAELGRIAERDPSIDLRIDKKTLEEAKRGGVVIDSHLAGWVLAGIADFSVYLKAPLAVRVKRVAGREKTSLSEALMDIVGREESQWRRFKALYGFDITDLSVFDLVIETSNYEPEEIVEIIINSLPRRVKARLHR